LTLAFNGTDFYGAQSSISVNHKLEFGHGYFKVTLVMLKIGVMN